ncbi:unnamed protein product [Candidula unifasciata]|uniref:Uncharacterized protein n=1 Tax=Candidula unifasciata TaxID=100452 RepID=A0A8S3YRM7_9EUPU|nr:unnamed protein product [Candidula unifasciata]
MKRKATNTLGNEDPAKISKDLTDGSDIHGGNSSQSTDNADDSVLTSPRSSSGRQRKAPAWLASYVTDGSTTIKESSKSEKPKIPASTASPVKKRGPKPSQQQPLKADNEKSKAEEDPPSLRRGSTLKVEDSPPHPPKNKRIPHTLTDSASLIRKDTEILSSSSDSGDITVKPEQVLKSTSVKPLLQNNVDEFPVSLQSASMSTLQCQPLPESPSEPSSKEYFTPESNIDLYSVEAQELNISDVMEICDTKSLNGADRLSVKAADPCVKGGELSVDGPEKSVILEKPKMLEVVICISTSGAMRDYLTVLQEKTRDLVWQLQSLIPDLRVGVLAHTQGGIHDDKPGSGSSAIDHNYIRTGGHSGTKWLDLGATFSQICAFVDSLEPEATVYPDYVQDNLEMALWKLQRCMSWSSCSYRTVVMIGRGRPNRTSFYLQREHWRGWIRSALEIGPKAEIPVIDWELEAKLLAQMGIHVFTIQASSAKISSEEDEDEGTTFFRRVAETTNGLHIRLTEASKLVDIIVGVCCACHGPDLLQKHRDTLRDENDGVLPPQLKDIFVSLQLHSKRRSLSTIPSLVGDLSLLKSQLAKADANGNISSSEEEEASGDETVQVAGVQGQDTIEEDGPVQKTPRKRKPQKKAKEKSTESLKNLAKKQKAVVNSGSKIKNLKPKTVKTGSTKKTKTIKVLKDVKIVQKGTKNVAPNKTKANKMPVSKQSVSNSSVKKQGLKGQDKTAKATSKKIPNKSKNLKAAATVLAVSKKNIKANAKSVNVLAAPQKKNKKPGKLVSNQS